MGILKDNTVGRDRRCAETRLTFVADVKPEPSISMVTLLAAGAAAGLGRLTDRPTAEAVMLKLAVDAGPCQSTTT